VSIYLATGLTGAAEVTFAGGFQAVSWVAVSITTEGMQVQKPQYSYDTEHILRAGYVTLGFGPNTPDPNFWLPPMWVNFHGSWFEGLDGRGWGDTWNMLRYSFTPGTVATINVN
jgi:hypothetical protein